MLKSKLLNSKVGYVFFVLLFFAFSKVGMSVPAYYTDDNGYESSSIYADVGSSKKEVLKTNSNTDVLRKSSVSDNGQARKVYNTIIVRTKKSNQKAEKIVESNQVTPLKPVNKLNVVETKEEKEDNTTAVGTFFRKVAKKATNPLYQTYTDAWYIYALASYGATSPSTLSTSIAEDAPEASTETRSLSSSSGWEGSGLGFIVGLKAYLFKSKFSLFLSPEFFYSGLNLKQNSFLYNSKQWADSIRNVETDSYGGSYVLPVELSMRPQDIFGGSFRLGLTVFNTVSVFAKASLGGTRSDIWLKPRPDWIDWNVHFGKETVEDRDNVIRNILTEVTDTPYLYKWDASAAESVRTNEENPTYLRNEKFTNKISLTYGLGAGIEATLWNQHLTFRLDYDHFWTTAKVTLSGTRYPRIGAQNQAVSAESKGITTADSGTKWRAKTHFGMFRFSVGISF